MDFILDLQLFAEGEEPEQQQESTANEEQQDQQPKVEFAIDQDGNVVYGEDEEGEESSEQEEQPPDNTYTPDELRQQTDFSKIDPNRLPKELQEVYRAMQAPFTRNMQQISELKQQLQGQLSQQQQQQAPPQQTAQQEQANVQPNLQRQYYEQVFNVAKTNIERNLGETFDELNPLHIASLAEEVANIKAHVVQTQAQQQTIDNVIRPYASDPEWENIRNYTATVLNSLPYEQSVAIRQRLDSGDIYFLNDFLKTSKEEYYRSKNKPAQQTMPKVKPPVVESSGAGVTNNQNSTFNPKNLGQLTNDQLAQKFVDLGLVDI